MLNVLGTGGVVNATGGGTSQALEMMRSAGSGTALSSVNLVDGVLIVNRVMQTSTGVGILTFNGGTLRANGGLTQTAFMRGLTAVPVYSRGATIDSSNSTITVGQNLIAPPGNGVTSITLNNYGSGYIGAPVVLISGGGGTGGSGGVGGGGGTGGSSPARR